MNHQPFKEWLLNDKNLTPAEKRQLNTHLRTCISCSALAETGFALRSARAVAPAAGFTIRFQQRLAAQRIAERRRRLWGMLLLTISGLGLLAWFTAPILSAVFSAPVEWFSGLIGFFLFAITSVQAMTEIVSVVARVAPGFVPPYVWMVLLSALAGFSLLWTISIWRFSSRRPQGVSA